MCSIEEKRQRLENLRKAFLLSMRVNDPVPDWAFDELEKAWKALEFYAKDRRFYLREVLEDDGSLTTLPSQVFEDAGKIAREALNS